MITNHPDGLSSFGIQLPSGGLPATKGKYIFVDYGSGNDGNSGKSTEEAVKTIAQAYSMATTNMDDIIVLMGSATHVLSEMLTVAKNRVHFIGLDGAGSRMYGQNAKVSLGVTTAATDIATMLNTGVRNTFRNIKFINGNTVAQGIYCVVESGEYTVYDGVEIYKSTDLDQTAAAEMVMNGDCVQMFNSTIGSLADAQTGTTIRACVLFNNGLAPSGTKQARECRFENVRFLKRSAHTTAAFVWWAAADDVEREIEFKDCAFINASNAAATPAVAVGGGAALNVGRILLTGNTYEVGCTALATQTGVFSSIATFAANGGSAIQAT